MLRTDYCVLGWEEVLEKRAFLRELCDLESLEFLFWYCFFCFGNGLFLFFKELLDLFFKSLVARESLLQARVGLLQLLHCRLVVLYVLGEILNLLGVPTSKLISFLHYLLKLLGKLRDLFLQSHVRYLFIQDCEVLLVYVRCAAATRSRSVETARRADALRWIPCWLTDACCGSTIAVICLIAFGETEEILSTSLTLADDGLQYFCILFDFRAVHASTWKGSACFLSGVSVTQSRLGMEILSVDHPAPWISVAYLAFPSFLFICSCCCSCYFV